MNPADMHKQHILGALDHIDGMLGNFMHKSKQHLADAGAQIAGQNPGGTGPNPDYEGKDKPGGHAGHSFGASKDQMGSNNSHFGHTAQGDASEAEEHQGDNEEGSGLNFAKKKNDGGMSALKMLMSR